MIPLPNLIAGVLIGIANDSWGSILLSALGWGVIFCLYVSMMESERSRQTKAMYSEKGKKLILGSPTLTFHVVEYSTGFLTSLLFGVITFLVRTVF